MMHMLRDSINGLEKVFDSDIPKGSIVLVVGTEGTLKSSLVFSMISNYLASSGEHGLYVTLEQTKDSYLQNMASLGLKRNDALHIFDYKDMRREWKGCEPDMIETTEEIIRSYKDEHHSLTVFAIDSLNALYALSEVENLRGSIYHFFSMLKENELTSFLIIEACHLGGPELLYNPCQPERFLADGLIELGIIENADGVKRYIQIRKMRAVKHAMEKHQLIISKGGLDILGQIY